MTPVAACPVCGASVRVLIEPPERRHGYFYPGDAGVDSTKCDCRERVDYGELGEDEWCGTLEDYDEACILGAR